MSDEKPASSSNIEGEIQSHKVAPVEYPPSYNDATHHHPPGGMQGPPGSHYPNLPPPGSDIAMQPMSGSAPYSQGYPSAPNYGPSQPPYPSPYPPPMTNQPAPLGFANPQQPPPGMMPQQPPPGMMPQQPPPGMMPPPNQAAGGEYNYPQTYVVVPPGDQNQQRRDSDLDCCKCLLCCCGCIELCRCFGMCLKCICDSD